MKKIKIRQYPRNGGKYIKEFDSIADAQHELGRFDGGISKVCCNKAGSSVGYQWRHSKDNIESLPHVSHSYKHINKAEYKSALLAFNSVFDAYLPNTIDVQTFSCKRAEKKFKKLYESMHNRILKELDKYEEIESGRGGDTWG